MPGDPSTGFNDNDETGYFGALYVSREGGNVRYIYANRGTEFQEKAPINGGRDFWASIQQGVPVFGAPKHYNHAIDVARLLHEKLPAGSLTFVGHSLGGGLAAAQSLATGRPAITFNPSGARMGTVRKYGLTPDLRPDQIKSYVAEGDPLNWMSDALRLMPDANGRRTNMYASYDRMPGQSGNWSPMSRGAVFIDSLAQHSRSQLLNGILKNYGVLR